MKKLYFCLAVMISASVFVFGCDSKNRVEDQNSTIEGIPIEEISIEDNSVEEVGTIETEEIETTDGSVNYPFSKEELEQTIKAAIEDDIWFYEKKSDFYHCINQEIEYEYKFTKDDYLVNSHVTVFPLIEPNKEHSLYYVMSFDVDDGKIIDRASYSGAQTIEEVRIKLMPEEEVIGKGTVKIGERRKPLYDASEEDIELAKENILKWMEAGTSIGGLNIEDVYIRNFYKNSKETIMFYTYDGERCCRSVYLAGAEGYKPVSVEEIDQGYVERMMECSFPVGEVPPLDEETENSIIRMLEEKTEQKLKTAIEDDIWFGYEDSIFYPYINQDIQYEYNYSYYYKEEHGFVFAIPIVKPDKNSLYYRIGFDVRAEEFGDGQLSRGTRDFNELKGLHFSKTPKKSKVSIGERREPPYNVDEADIKEVKENIRKLLEEEYRGGSLSRDPDNDKEIYIKNFYKDSLDTIMLFTYKGELNYSYVNLDGSWRSAPVYVEESKREYYERMLESSFPLYE